MSKLPQFQTKDNALSLMQNKWASVIDPVLGSPIATPILLTGITLSLGSNTINHKLDAPLQGWMVVRKRGQALIYDNQDNNPLPQKTLLLVSSSGVNVDLLVF